MRVKFHVGTTYVGSGVTEFVELPDEITDEELEIEFEQWVWENIDANWEKA